LLFLCEDYTLDTDRRELRRGAALLPVEPQVFDLLAFLIGNHHRVVSKDDLLAAVWGGRIVSESTIASRINAARRAIGDSGEQQRLIRTVIGKGVRFVGAVRQQPAGAEPAIRAAMPRLSIVVLPFTSLSNDPEQQYFADGITEDLTTDLARIENMFVISCNTAFTYRNKSIDTKQIGRELGVRYVLEGSVRRSGNQLRVSAQLIDAATDAHLWADRFDGGTGDLFALQNEITSRLANALGIELIAAEAAQPIEHPEALDYILRGRAARLRPNSPDVFAEAISLFERALELDPRSVEAQTLLANSLVGRVDNGMTDTAAADLARAEGLAGRALAASPRSAFVHLVKGRVLRIQNRWEEAVPEFETALALDRNLVAALTDLGWCKLSAGSIEEAMSLVEQAIRLSPRDPAIGWRYFQIGTVHLVQSRTDEAIVWLEKARSSVPAAPSVRRGLASAYALREQTERAAAELGEARRLSSDDRFSTIARLKATANFGTPKTRALFEATYFAGLRKAGMPDQ
jgi:TolB-like protein/Tfp pilus assembly protein PilF